VDALGFTCLCCEHFATAKTPLDHVFRKMWAWKRVSNQVPCPHLNGINGNGKKLIKGNLDASVCPFFRLVKARINPVYFEEIKKIDEGAVVGKSNRAEFFEDIEDKSSKIADVEARMRVAQEALAKAKEEKREIEDKRNFAFLTRYTDDKIPQNLSSLFGVQLGSDYQTMLDNKVKIREAGYDPDKMKSIDYTISSQDVAKIIQKGLLESLGYRSSGFDLNGNSINEYVGQKISFDTMPYKVVRRGAKRMVIFRETDANYLSRRDDPFYKALFADDKIQWRFPVIEKPTFDLVENEENDVPEEEENDFIENETKNELGEEPESGEGENV
jgi:hypothetical protein